ncbi:potassium intermediate small conductance calcium-activated channel, sub N, member [Phytophthora pseudosyringae]|uniref:Potassium intermediate small conductance calcium-activated channel, sub N, member n=1 Tax=Phytophthora pseudosyringae TaxID=221518 RepID=A0A8T1WGQ9_9STRA|nr:potassium intermediate small conductance calcium-activated channel, sub N, member [Phytophthora pseudosyringae]
MLVRRKSSRLEEERQAVEQQVEDAFKLQSAGNEASDVALLRRNSSAYLPPNLGDNLRVAKHVIQDVYSLQELYERQHFVENVACAIAMTGVLLVILDNEYVVNKSSKLALRIANSVLTKILLSLIGWRFILERRILVRRNVLPPNVTVFRMPKQLMQLALELAVCFIIVPPGTDGSFEVREWKYFTDDGSCGAPFVVRDGSCYLEYVYPFEILGLFSLLRLYMIPRVIRNVSSFASYHTSYLGALHRVDTMTPLFAIKCFLQSHPFRLLLAAFSGTLVITSYALAIVEAPVNPNLAPLSNTVWLVALTMATIGYGDVVPVTTAGQVLLVFGGMVAGILLIAALSAALFALLRLDDRDKRFIHSLRLQQYDCELNQACASTIQTAWRRFHEFKPGTHPYRKRKENSVLFREMLFA